MDMDPLISQNIAHLRRINRRPATIEHRTGILLRLAAFLGKPLADVTPADLMRWQDTLTGRISAASVSTYVGLRPRRWCTGSSLVSGVAS